MVRQAQAEARRARARARTPMPTRIAPELATLVSDIPDSGEWLYEVKFDGYRAVSYVDHGEVRIISRNDKDWSTKLGPLAEHLAELPCEEAILDGELVVILPDGSTDFQALQTTMGAGAV